MRGWRADADGLTEVEVVKGECHRTDASHGRCALEAACEPTLVHPHVELRRARGNDTAELGRVGITECLHEVGQRHIRPIVRRRDTASFFLTEFRRTLR